jgi:hypothetical protein
MIHVIDNDAKGKYEQADAYAKQRRPYPQAFGLAAHFNESRAFHLTGNADEDEQESADRGEPYMKGDMVMHNKGVSAC